MTTGGRHGAGFLIDQTFTTTGGILLAAAAAGWPLAVGLVGARDAARRDNAVLARRWLLGSAVTTLLLPLAVGWHGGASRGLAVIGVAFAGLLAATTVAAWSSRWRPGRDVSGTIVVGVLLLVPVLQGAGTNVSLPYIAGECVAMWVAMALVLVTEVRVSALASNAVLVDLVVLVVATALIGGTTTLLSPFETTPYSQDTAGVSGLGLRLSPQVARQDVALRDALRPHVVPDVTPVLTLDRIATFTDVVGGAPAGSTWTEPFSFKRTAGILALACRYGDLRADLPPVLIVDRPVDPALARAMGTCGFPFPSRYREIPVPGGPPGLHVYVPRTRS